MTWTEQKTYVINKYDLKLRFSIDIQVISLKSKKQQDKNKKVCFTEDWLDTICPKSSLSLLEVLDNQIRNEINVMKENKMFLDRHLGWRSLDPTLDISSHFVKKKEKSILPPIFFFSIFFLSPPLLH